MGTIRRLLGAVVAAVIAAALVPGAAQAADFTLTPLREAVAAGETIEFAGAGFAPRERIAVWTTAPDQAVLGGDYFVASADGTVRVAVDIPDDAIGGTWAVTVWGRRTKTPVSTQFHVVGRAPDAAEVQITVTPEAGAPGTPFVFTAVGFRRSERVSYWVTGPDNRVYSAFPEGARSNERGEVEVVWIAPINAPAGTSVMTIQGIRSGVARGIPLEIR